VISRVRCARNEAQMTLSGLTLPLKPRHKKLVLPASRTEIPWKTVPFRY
jgi:hypothetical protein